MRTLVVRGREQLDNAARVVAGLNPDRLWRVVVMQHRTRRTNDQNKLLWAIYTEIARETGNDPEDIHEAMKARFIPPVMVKLGEELVAVNGTTHDKDTKEFSEFVDKVQAFASSELGILV